MTKPRREKGTGGLYQRKADGMWCGSVELPSPDGKKRRRKVIARARKDEALAALRQARKDLERTGDLPTASPTLATWLDLWFTRVATPRLKVSTRPTYRGHIDRYIVPAIGKVRLDKLNPAHVQRLHEYITGDLDLSPTTALQSHRILAKALTDAMREGRVNRNVATLVDAPRKARVKKVYLDATEGRTLLRHAATDPTRADEAARWAVALLTGARPGERLGLTHDEINFDTNTITIAWQLQRLTYIHGCGTTTPDGTWLCGRKRGGNCPQRGIDVPADQEVRHLEGGLYLTRPKSAAGWREVPMAPLLREMLHRYTQARPPGAHGLVFTRDGHRPIDPSDDSAAWDTALRAAGLPDVNRHSARHTCATLLDELGVPENVRVQILGHASGTTTAIYTHVADSRTVEAMDRLGGLLDYRETPPAAIG